MLAQVAHRTAAESPPLHPLVSCVPADQASIIAGAVISVLSVTWAAYSSAGNAQKSLVVGSTRGGFPPPGALGASNPVADVEAGHVKEWKGGAPSSPSAVSSSGAPKGDDGAAVAYQSVNTAAGAGASTSTTTAALDAEYAQDDKPTKADKRPWLFHVIMALGGLYLGMALTNWGTASA